MISKIAWAVGVLESKIGVCAKSGRLNSSFFVKRSSICSERCRSLLQEVFKYLGIAADIYRLYGFVVESFFVDAMSMHGCAESDEES
jgi:hypothetical protein